MNKFKLKNLNEKPVENIPRWINQLRNNINHNGYNSDLYQIFLIQHEIRKNVRSSFLYDFCKRAFDLSLSIPALILLAPFLLVVGVLIKLDSKGPVFFIQERAGKDFRIFNILKFRTMTEHADLEKHELLQKDAVDLRTTRLGKILRKWKIDELPQLCNVILGDMSIVGPRPFSLEESVFVEKANLKRFAALPGLTGLWQATRSNTISAFDKFKLDSEYVEKRSFFFDLSLILKTIPRIMKGEGSKKVEKKLELEESKRAA